MALPKLTQLAKGSLSQLKLPPEGFYGTPSTLVIQAHQQSNEKNSIRSQGFSLTRSRSSAISGSPKLMENREIFLCSLQVSLFLRFRTGLSCKTVTSLLCLGAGEEQGRREKERGRFLMRQTGGGVCRLSTPIARCTVPEEESVEQSLRYQEASPSQKRALLSTFVANTG